MIRVLIADNSRLVCDSLRSLLNGGECFYVVGCATTAEEVDFSASHCNVVLLGARLEDVDALTVLESLRVKHPTVKVIVMGIGSEPETILRYVEAGAVGYVMHNESTEDMMRKLHAIREEKALVSPQMAALMMERLAQLANFGAISTFRETKVGQLDELTPRERQILDLIGDGLTNQEIANRLYIECGTVKNHVHSILQKLEISNRHEAASVYRIHRHQNGSMAMVQ
jgi:DNA-binding NarL/FixJ family response regulator